MNIPLFALGAENFANSAWMYLLYAAIVVVVCAESIWYMVKSIRRAKELNMDMGKIKKVISSSIIFTILPSIGIFVGIITLAGPLGIPLPAIRLSVIGALQYETQTVDFVAIQMGFLGGLKDLIAANAINEKSLITFAMGMTFGIIWGPLFCIFFFKKMQPKMTKKVSSNPVWADAVFAAVFIGMVLAYLSVAIAGALNPEAQYRYLPIVALVVAALSMWGCDALITKKNQKWLENFSLAFSMLMGMASAGLLDYLMA